MPLLDEATAAAEAVETEKLTRGARSGAHWFYWIAGLSVVNSVTQLFGSSHSFVIGLGATQVIDAIARGATEGADAAPVGFVRGIAFVLDALAAGLFALFGWQAARRRHWAFMVGMVLYALDGAIFLLVQDWLSLGFHAFALFGIWSGYACVRKLQAAEVQLGTRPIAPGA